MLKKSQSLNVLLNLGYVELIPSLTYQQFYVEQHLELIDMIYQ